MLQVVLPVLAAASKLYMYGQGGKVILKTAEELTGVPAHSVVSGFVEEVTTDTRNTFQSVYKPVINGSVFRKAYEITGLKTVAEPIMAGIDSLVDDAISVVAGPSPKQIAAGAPKRVHAVSRADLPTRPINRTVAGGSLRKNAQTLIASAKAKGLEALERAKAVELQVSRESDATRKSEMQNSARASQRLVTVANRSIARAQVAGNDEDMLRYAAFANESALAAMDPPTDPHDVLASDAVDAATKERLTTIIDSLNRVQEPDYERIIDLGVGNDVSPIAAGGDHDHEHACGGNCGQACCEKPTGGVSDYMRWGDETFNPKASAAPPAAVAGDLARWRAEEAGPPPADIGEYTKWGAFIKDEAPKPKATHVDPDLMIWTGEDEGGVGAIDDEDYSGAGGAPSGDNCKTGFCRRPPPKDTIYRRG